MIPEDRKYTKEHEWVARTGDDTVRVGITYQPGVRPGLVVLPAPGLDSVRAIIDRDLTRIAPETIRDAQVMMTVVGGRVVYDRTATPGGK